MATVPERRFQRVLSSLTTRESSTLVIASLASSTSLVLLGLTLTEVVSKDLAGFLLPIAGLTYRESTLFTIDYKDLDELNYYTEGMRRDPRGFVWVSHLRRLLVRFFLLSPSSLWLVDKVYPDLLHQEGPNILWPIAIIALTALLLGFSENRRNTVLRAKRGEYQVP